MNSIMSAGPLWRNEAELTAIRARIAEGRDGPVLMLNLNTYTPVAGFPHGAGYRAYMAALEALLGEAGARVLWRYPVEGQMVGGSGHLVDDGPADNGTRRPDPRTARPWPLP